MVSELRLYFEGDDKLREGFHHLFSEVVEKARERRIGFRFIAGKGHAVGDFIKSLHKNPGSTSILLIDSEGPDDGMLFHRLKQRSDWKPPAKNPVDDSSVIWMVQCMESWFLTDPGALSSYYGKDFAASKLPQHISVEAVDKDQVIESLKAASRDTKKGEYHKTKHAPQILKKLSPAKARSASHCASAFTMLLEIIAQ